MSVQREPLPFRVAAAGVFGYEIVALFTNLPTISALNDRYPWLGRTILVGLGLHFRQPRNVRWSKSRMSATRRLATHEGETP